MDHKHPKVYGGVDDIKNLVPCCEKCNKEKGAMLYKEFHYWIRCGRPDWGKKTRIPYKTHDETVKVDYVKFNHEKISRDKNAD